MGKKIEEKTSNLSRSLRLLLRTKLVWSTLLLLTAVVLLASLASLLLIYIEGKAAENKSKKFFAVIQSQPAGAKFFLDGDYYGNTPLRIEVEAEKNYSIRLYKKNYYMYSKTTALQISHTYQLIEKTYERDFVFKPAAQQVFVNAKKVFPIAYNNISLGVSKTKKKQLAKNLRLNLVAGENHITVLKEGYYIGRFTLSIQESEIQDIESKERSFARKMTLSLEPAAASSILFLESIPHATVKLDGVDLGNTPLRVAIDPAENVILEFARPFFISKKIFLSPRNWKSHSVKVELEKQSVKSVLTIYVFDDEGNSLPEARVLIQSGLAPALIESGLKSDRARLEGLPGVSMPLESGKYRLTIRHKGYLEREEILELAENQALSKNIELLRLPAKILRPTHAVFFENFQADSLVKTKNRLALENSKSKPSNNLPLFYVLEHASGELRAFFPKGNSTSADSWGSDWGSFSSFFLQLSKPEFSEKLQGFDSSGSGSGSLDGSVAYSKTRLAYSKASLMSIPSLPPDTFIGMGEALLVTAPSHGHASSNSSSNFSISKQQAALPWGQWGDIQSVLRGENFAYVFDASSKTLAVLSRESLELKHSISTLNYLAAGSRDRAVYASLPKPLNIGDISLSPVLLSPLESQNESEPSESLLFSDRANNLVRVLTLNGDEAQASNFIDNPLAGPKQPGGLSAVVLRSVKAEDSSPSVKAEEEPWATWLLLVAEAGPETNTKSEPENDGGWLQDLLRMKQKPEASATKLYFYKADGKKISSSIMLHGALFFENDPQALAGLARAKSDEAERIRWLMAFPGRRLVALSRHAAYQYKF